jgi:hypothetical protein
MNRLWCLLALLVAGALVVGCKGDASDKVKVTGQLVQNGKSLKFDNQVMKTMVFHPYESILKTTRNCDTYPAGISDDGSFEAQMPPGKYVITLTLVDGKGDMCKGAFEVKEKSQLIREIGDGKGPMQIDIAKVGG